MQSSEHVLVKVGEKKPEQFEQVYSEVHGDKKVMMQRNKDHGSDGFRFIHGGTYLKIEVYPSNGEGKPISSYEVIFGASTDTYRLYAVKAGQKELVDNEKFAIGVSSDSELAKIILAHFN